MTPMSSRVENQARLHGNGAPGVLPRSWKMLFVFVSKIIAFSFALNEYIVNNNKKTKNKDC